MFYDDSNPAYCLTLPRQPSLCPVVTWVGFAYVAEGIGYCYPEITVTTGQDIDYYIQTCRNITSDTDMISIHSIDENDFIRDNFGATILGLHISGGVWSPTNFVWSDGSSLDYTNWDSGTSQPDDGTGNEFFTSLTAAG